MPEESEMNTGILSLLIVGAMVTLMVLGLPLAFSIGAVAVCLTLYMFEPSVLTMLVSRIFEMSLDTALVSVPLFVMMASILKKSGIAEQLFNAVHIWSGRLRGGLAVGTILANLIMAAMVGIVGAEIVTFGLFALPVMLERKYDYKLALGSITAGGGLATLIPPSIVFIIYGMITGTSIGDLFIAGIVPGVILCFSFIGYILWHCWRNPEAAPIAAVEDLRLSIRQKLAMQKSLIAPILLAGSVLGSLYAGIATPTEAAAVGVGGAVICAILNRKLSWAMCWSSSVETVRVSAMMAWLIFGAQTLIGAYTLAGGTDFVKNLMISMDLGPWGTIILINLIWVFLGCIIDWIGICMLTVPIFFPIVKSYGFDPVWFGVVFCMNMHIAYLSPPFAMSAFYTKSISPPEVTMTDIYSATLPYLYMTVVVTIIMVAFPSLSLWLPLQMR